MDKSPIVVSKWRIYVRRFMDGLGKFSTLVWKIRSIGEPRRPRIKILSKPTLSEDGATSVTPKMLRIKHRPAGAESTDSVPDPTPVPGRFSRPKKSGAGNSISVNLGLELCKACREPLNDGDDLARCNVESSHTIHRRCIRLMKRKCPHCGGIVT